MNPFIAMLLSLRIGFAPTAPAASAALSIRDETLQVATAIAERDKFVHRGSEPARVTSVLVRSAGAARAVASAAPWAPPARVDLDAQRQQWRDAIARTLNGSDRIANMAMWLASAPVRLRVNHDKVFVAITLRTP